MNDSTGATVELRRVSRRFGEVTAVETVDLSLRPGAMTALLGPSGCGKSTTLALIAGLQAPDSGDVHIDGAAMTTVPAERRPVAMVFQKPLLFPHLDVAGNVGFGLRMRRLPRREIRARVDAALAQMQLSGLAHRRVGQLSGGQEQRVALARALVLQPRVLLLDEPFSQLDAGLRAEMRGLVRQLQARTRITTLFVTHDQAEAVDVADDIVLMLDGRIAGHGPPPLFYSNPPSLDAARFFGVTNELPGRVSHGIWRSPDGALRVPCALPDGPAILTVRPEALHLAGPGDDPGEEDPPLTVTGTVASARFAGTHLAVRVQLSGDRTVTAHTPVGTPVPVGGKVRLSMAPDACTVFAAARA
ncbi:ABC transporter ATP-binding protein [Actinoplanes sp. NPDC023801]|uniref:ABC transporter ATP-binding protein n=1 Tax=Actinoplanes sp. NPDC023801 TaxID=3154595 RepID=UPI0033F5B159